MTTTTLMTCPGRCGASFPHNQHGTLSLNKHLARCIPGIRNMEMLRLFGVWMLERLETIHTEINAGGVQLPELSRHLVKSYMDIGEAP